MIRIRASQDRGRVKLDWLESYHSFSFGEYYDPEHMGFRALRVINEDFVAPGSGFPPHGHRDMEIVTYILEGELEHKDSLGTGSVIRPGEVQRMSAGKGIIHSEFNPSQEKPVHLLQIWILPEQPGGSPSYEQKQFEIKQRPNSLILIGSQPGEQGPVRIHQDVNLYAIYAKKGGIEWDMPKNRYAWVQVARGEVQVNDHKLTAGDAAAIEGEKLLKIISETEGEALLFDLA